MREIDKEYAFEDGYNAAANEPKGGDTISREALREDLRRFFPTEVLEGIEPKTLFAQIMHDIDNAPTVEPRIEYRTDGQPYRLFMSGGQVVPDTLQGWRYEERPQGDIRWTDKLAVTSSGDIIDFQGRVVGHIDLEVMKGGAENDE